jgi:transposase
MQFNALVVTPIVEKAKGTEAAKKELAELLAEAAEKVRPRACCCCCCIMHTDLLEPTRQQRQMCQRVHEVVLLAGLAVC